MPATRIVTICLALLVFVFVSIPLATAQAPANASPAARYIKVDAPLAQKLVLAAKAQHPEIKKIGMHAVPPGATESAIIGSDNPAKIGKVSSANDLTVVTSGTPRVYPHPEEGGFFDLGLPMFDREHRPFGMMVLEIPYKDATTPDTALSMGTKIHDELAAKIPSKQALFQ